jgi:cation diffusion facilitator CzcD-associated flavoprotein CzcO
LSYLKETASEYDIEKHVRYQQQVVRASWSSEDARWTLEVESGPEKSLTSVSCNFLHMCSGYYSYKGGYTPEWKGADQFRGRVVHPQQWTEDIDYEGKQVVVIGSGATAVTLVPELAKKAASVTMLQRSPTFVVARPEEDALANWMNDRLPAMLAYGITRWRNVLLGMFFFWLSRKRPAVVKSRIIDEVRKQLGPDYDVDTHFTPRYNPWDQRMCLVPNGDLFRALRKKQATVVTDQIETFTETGIKLQSGAELEADLIVTATGLDLVVLGEMEVFVDGERVDPSKTISYKGMMFSDVPNLAASMGYTNASWTLKCDLTSEYVCRLLNHMKRKDYQQCTPRRTDPNMKEEPWIDFSSGYVQRSLHKFPKQGSKTPWKLHQNYALDIMSLSYGRIEDGAMEFGKVSKGGQAQA